MTDDERALLGDEYERLRTKMLGLLMQHETLLSDCLSAIRKPDPLVYVADDHVDRVLNTTRTMIAHLNTVRLTQKGRES